MQYYVLENMNTYMFLPYENTVSVQMYLEYVGHIPNKCGGKLNYYNMTKSTQEK